MAMNKETQDRITLVVDKEFKKLVMELAKEETRSTNGFIINAIKEYIKNNHSDIDYK